MLFLEFFKIYLSLQDILRIVNSEKLPDALPSWPVAVAVAHVAFTTIQAGFSTVSSTTDTCTLDFALSFWPVAVAVARCPMITTSRAGVGKVPSTTDTVYNIKDKIQKKLDPMKTIKSHIHIFALTIFQSYTFPVIHSSSHTLFQSYTIPILHSSNL